MDGNALVLCQCYLGTGRLAVLERWSHLDNNALVVCQCYLGTGRLAVLERWPHYRGGRQCFSALSVLFKDREVGCFREMVTLQRWTAML